MNHTKKSTGVYGQTVNLPQTKFPMRANLPQTEPETLQLWEAMDLYRCVQERTRGHEQFILHDGPPFSNGNIHLGHALNKILKDFVVKFRSMQGFDAPYVPGWDTHGLPTEIAAIRAFALDHRRVTPLELRHRCADIARRFVDLQREQFKRLGVRGDWDRPYLTMHKSYEAGVLGVFRRLVEQGVVYRGLKPVYWCTACETALAEAEIEYREHEAHSIYVAFPVLRMAETLFPGVDRTKMAAVIWTTTPWTLPANVAVAVNPEFTYALVTDEADKEHFTYLVASKLLESFSHEVDLQKRKVLGEVSGRELEGVVLLHPFMSREAPIVLADYVTLEGGTGLVHIAPGHGKDDFITGVSYGLPMIQPVDHAGIYGPEAGPYAGKSIYEAEPQILSCMDKDGTLLAHDTILHQYPHCWRCRGPVIFRATRQWFIAVDQFTDRSLQAIEGVQWQPEWGKERITGMVEDRPDWCISRQRSWGIPIPAFYCTNCNTPLLSPDAIARTEAIFREEGSDAWYSRPVHDFLPADTTCASCGVSEFRKETDIFDVWFDSGSSHAVVLEGNDGLTAPADLYLEGQDQYRGWFQVSLLTQVGMGRTEAPYRGVLSHGFILDQTGRKQSKSLGNIIDPQEVVSKYGADILRLWVASMDTRADVAMSEDAFSQVVEVYRRIRNTARFLLGNLFDFTPEMARPLGELEEIDRWALHRLNMLVTRVTEAMARYEFHRVYQLLNEFCAADLSAFYLDVLKDRLYISLPDDPRRRAAQTVLYWLAETLAQLLAPVLSFTAEEIWQHLPGDGHADSVQLTNWPRPRVAWTDDALAAKWTHILAVRDQVNAAVTAVRAHHVIAQPLQAKVIVYSAGETSEAIESLGDALAEVLIVSAAEAADLAQAPPQAYRGAWPELAVVVTHAPGAQCERCRQWRTLGQDRLHADLCARCASIVARWPKGRTRAA